MQATPNKAKEGFRITGDWKVISKKLKEKFKQLTDADLKFEAGKEEDLLKRVETRLKKKREDVIKLLNEGQIKTA